MCRRCGSMRYETVEEIRRNIRYPEEAEAMHSKIKWCECVEGAQTRKAEEGA
jgi:hypothetical protein